MLKKLQEKKQQTQINIQTKNDVKESQEFITLPDRPYFANESFEDLEIPILKYGFFFIDILQKSF